MIMITDVKLIKAKGTWKFASYSGAKFRSFSFIINVHDWWMDKLDLLKCERKTIYDLIFDPMHLAV